MKRSRRRRKVIDFPRGRRVRVPPPTTRADFLAAYDGRRVIVLPVVRVER